MNPRYQEVADGRGGTDRKGHSQGGWCGRRIKPCGHYPWELSYESQALRCSADSPHLLQTPLVRVPLLGGHRLTAAQQPYQVQL